MSKTALILGITGMDGSYMAEYLLSLGYAVHGLVRRRATPGQDNLAAVRDRITLHDGDITDADTVLSAFEKSMPADVYNFAGVTHIGYSWECPAETVRANTLGPQNILDAVRRFHLVSHCRVYLAGSVEFLSPRDPVWTETTPVVPNSPYAAAKAASYHLARVYRERYGLHVSTGILGNHTSERRPESFVTRKITASVARIARGEQSCLALGDIDSPLDIGYAPDYVRAFRAMLQQPAGGDYVIATGERHTLREWLSYAFGVVGIGEGEWERLVAQDNSLLRPAQTRIPEIRADKARGVLGWEPETGFHAMVERLLEHDLGDTGP